MRKRLAFILVLCLLAAVSCTGQTAPKVADNKPADSLRVLFIGNSYTYYNNLPQMLEKMAAGVGKNLTAEMVIAGGATLQTHWEQGRAVQTIRQAKWDFVVLQEQSTLGNGYLINREGRAADPSDFYKYARLFDREIRKSGAETVFFLTWTRENARPEEQKVLSDAYLSIARELKARVAPVGIIWQRVRSKNPKLKLYNEDQSHPNSSGSYLAANVFYSSLYGKTPVGLTHQIRGNMINLSGKVDDSESLLVDLSKTDAQLIQNVAWETYRELKTD